MERDHITKKSIILSLTLVPLHSAAYAGGGWSGMAKFKGFNEFSHYARKIPIQKRTFTTERKTQGFIPKHQSFPIGTPFKGLPEDAKQIDEKGEYFYSPSLSQLSTKISPIQKEGNHTVKVELITDDSKKK